METVELNKTGTKEKLLENYIKNKYGTLIHLSIGFFLIFFGYFSYSSMISQISSQLKFNNLGLISLAITYFVFSIANIFATKIFSKIFNSFKIGIIISSIGYIILVCSGIFPTSCTMDNSLIFCNNYGIYTISIISSIITGIFGALIWVGQTGYITQLCSQNTIGIFFGIFWSILYFASVISTTFTSILLKYSSQMNFFIISACISCFGSFILCLLPKSESYEINQIGNRKTFILLLKNNKMIILSIYSFSSGCIMAIINGTVYILVQNSLDLNIFSKNQINVKTAYVLIVQSSFSFLCGIFIGKIADYFNKVNVLIFSNLLFFLSLVILAITFLLKNYTMCFLSLALLGSVDVSMNCLFNIIVSSKLNNQLEGYTICRLFQGIGYVIFMLFAIFLRDNNYLIFIGICFLCQIFALFSLFKFKKI